jgi:ribosomal protein S18 acetylase RimI-like enzyme
MTPEPITAGELAARAPEVHELYRRCFAEPPWNEPPEQLARYPEDLARFLAKPGISAMAVWDGQTMAGLIYGWPSPTEFPDDPFHNALTAAVSTVDPLLAPAFDVVELMVDPAFRGRGLGKALLTEFVRGHDTAWLVTHPDAPARGLYERAGWKPFGEFTNHLGDPRLIYTWSRGPADVQAGRLAEDQAVRGGRPVQAEPGKVEQPA